MVVEPKPLVMVDDESEDYDSFHWADDGCDLHDRCLTCPFPRCKYDEPRHRELEFTAYSPQMRARDARICLLRADGMQIKEISVQVGVSLRTIYRALARREGDAEPR